MSPRATGIRAALRAAYNSRESNGQRRKHRDPVTLRVVYGKTVPELCIHVVMNFSKDNMTLKQVGVSLYSPCAENTQSACGAAPVRSVVCPHMIPNRTVVVYLFMFTEAVSKARRARPSFLVSA